MDKRNLFLGIAIMMMALFPINSFAADDVVMEVDNVCVDEVSDDLAFSCKNVKRFHGLIEKYKNDLNKLDAVDDKTKFFRLHRRINAQKKRYNRTILKAKRIIKAKEDGKATEGISKGELKSIMDRIKKHRQGQITLQAKDKSDRATIRADKIRKLKERRVENRKKRGLARKKARDMAAKKRLLRKKLDNANGQNGELSDIAKKRLKRGLARKKAREAAARKRLERLKGKKKVDLIEKKKVDLIGKKKVDLIGKKKVDLIEMKKRNLERFKKRKLKRLKKRKLKRLKKRKLKRLKKAQ